MTGFKSDEELLAAVRGLGAEREPDDAARAHDSELDAEGKLDLRGDRDRDPDARHPWRSA